MESIESYIEKSVNRYVDFIESSAEDMPSTFKDLDSIIRGFRPGQLSVVSGIPGVGKTAFVLSMLYRMSFRNNTGVQYITTESNIDQISDRLIQIALDRDLEEIKGMKPQDFRNQCEMNLMFGLFPFDIHSSLQSYESYEDIKEKIIELASNGKVDCVCIDSLQSLWLKDRKSLPNGKKTLGEIVHDFRLLASNLNIHIFLVSNMIDPEIYSEYYQDRYYTKWMNQSGDGNACSQYSDVFILLDRPEVYDIYEDSKGNDLRGILKVNVIKNRNGESGKVNLRFRSGRVTEIPEFYHSSSIKYMNEIINEEAPF